jgi:hypothetical protein
MDSIASHMSWALQRSFSISVFLLQLVCASDWKATLFEVIVHRPLELGVQVHERVRVLGEDVRETDALRTEKQGGFVNVNAESRILSHDVLLRLTAIPLTGSNQYCVFAAPSQHPEPAFLPYFESRKFKHSPTLCPTSSRV